MKKRLIKIISIICIIGVCTAILYCAYAFFFNPRRGEIENIEKSMPLNTLLGKEQAVEDALYLYDKLKYHHPAWLEKNNPNIEFIDQFFLSINKNLPDEISVLDLWRTVSSAVSILHDGHTKIAWKNPGEDLYIEDFTIPEFYGRPVKINYQNSEEILSDYLKLSSYEYDFYAIRKFYDSVLYTKHYLDFLGVDTSTGITYTYLEDGIPVNFYFEFVPYKNVKKAAAGSESAWVSYSTDEKTSSGILTLKECNLNDEYRTILRSFFNEVSNKGIQNIAVDLRGNGGGNSGVANEFIEYIDIDSYKSWDCAVRFGPVLWKSKNIVIKNDKKENTFKGNIFIMTDVYSYSSAMDFAMLIKDNNLGFVIGESSGNSPDSYGDNLYFQMPNSKLYFSLSHKKWYRINKDKAGLPIEPDYECASKDCYETFYSLIGQK